MNKVQLFGRTVTEIEIKYSSSDDKTAVGRFRIAVPRRNKETDFFSCVAFGKTAENMATYFRKGDRVLIGGRIETNQYTTKDGQKATSVQIVVEEFDFIEPKREETEELPFNLTL